MPWRFISEFLVEETKRITSMRPQLLEEPHRMGKNSRFNNAFASWKHEKSMPLFRNSSRNHGALANMADVSCVSSTFYPGSLFRRTKRRLMRSPYSLCVCVFPQTPESLKNEPEETALARFMRLRCCLCPTPIVARKRLVNTFPLQRIHMQRLNCWAQCFLWGMCRITY
jgi:hypothetical protein